MGLKDLFSKKKKQDPVPDSQPTTGQFPTYEDAIDDDVFVQSDKAKKIEQEEKENWEYHLFTASLLDNLNTLKPLKRQYRENPFVERIGTDSDGSSYLQFTSNLIGTLGVEVDRAASKIALCSDQFMDAIGAPGESGDPDEIKEVAIRFMDPYIRFLASYNDICMIRAPKGLEKLYHGEKRIFEDLMESFEKYYEDMAGNIEKWVANPDNDFVSPMLNCDLKSAAAVTEKLKRLNASDPELLQSAKIQRVVY